MLLSFGVTSSLIRHTAAAVLSLCFMPAALAADASIATVRSSEILQNAPQFKAGRDRLEQQFSSRTKSLESEAKRLADDIKAYQQQGAQLSAEERVRREGDLMNRKLAFEQKSQQLQQDRQEEEREVFSMMMADLKRVIDQIAKEKAYTVVIENPVFSAAQHDITAEVLTRLRTSGR